MTITHASRRYLVTAIILMTVTILAPNSYAVTGDDISDPYIVSTMPYIDSGTTVGFADDYDENCFGATGPSPDVVYTITPSVTQSVDIVLCNSDPSFWTNLWVYEDSVGNVSACARFHPDCPGPHSIIYGTIMTVGHTYYIVIDGDLGDAGDYVIEIDSEPVRFSLIKDPGNPILAEGSALGVNGCTWIDYDADGWEDLFIADDDSSYLYRNLSGGNFEKVVGDPLVSDTAHYRGIAWADYDNDGDIDAVQTGNSETAIFENDGTGNFTKRASSIWNSTDTRGYSPAWADYDNDGDVDLSLTFPQGVWSDSLRANIFFVNNGPPNWDFTLIDTGVVATGIKSYTIGNFSDYDQDGDMDYFVGSGPISSAAAPDDLYRNVLIENGYPGFERITDAPLATTGGDGQIWNLIDYDNDGDFDAYRINFGVLVNLGVGIPNDLFRNDGGTFVTITDQPLATSNKSSIGQVWEDFDNDGDLDCFVANSNSQADQIYYNNGDGSFTEDKIGTIAKTFGNSLGCTAGDYDNDGDIDLFVHAASQAARRLFRNDSDNGNGWVNIRLEGTVSNRTAVGARVRILATIGGTPVWQLREVSTQNTFCGHNSLIQHVGLGGASMIDSIRVEWPSGVVNDTGGIAINQTIALIESCADPDGDGITCTDNCPNTSNPSQTDANGDGVGDACCCIDIRGNINGDPGENIDVSDLTHLVGFMFKGGPGPACPAEANIDASVEPEVTIADLTALVGFMFKGGAAPTDCN